jgi:hypothetical protein
MKDEPNSYFYFSHGKASSCGRHESGADTDIDPALVTDHLRQLRKFSGSDLTGTLSRIESSVRGLTLVNCSNFLLKAGAGKEALAAAEAIKRIVGQINVTIHALGILLCLPHILEEGEEVEYASLGAGNTGRDFDLETNYRIAEFKFIHWRGGPESIRQNELFKDFFLLAESESAKRKYLYVLGTEHPLKFLNGRRAIMTSVLSKDVKLQRQFDAQYGKRFVKVLDYYQFRRDKVLIKDMSPWLRELASAVVAQETNDEGD